MTKELSKQICEICGIKNYVDFSKSQNYSRLLGIEPFKKHYDLFFEIYRVWEISEDKTEYKAAELKTKEDFLKMLLYILKGKYSKLINIKKQEIIKQAIREAEWKYE